jgi:hypothetical protein
MRSLLKDAKILLDRRYNLMEMNMNDTDERGKSFERK